MPKKGAGKKKAGGGSGRTSTAASSASGDVEAKARALAVFHAQLEVERMDVTLTTHAHRIEAACVALTDTRSAAERLAAAQALVAHIDLVLSMLRGTRARLAELAHVLGSADADALACVDDELRLLCMLLGPEPAVQLSEAEALALVGAAPEECAVLHEVKLRGLRHITGAVIDRLLPALLDYFLHHPSVPMFSKAQLDPHARAPGWLRTLVRERKSLRFADLCRDVDTTTLEQCVAQARTSSGGVRDITHLFSVQRVYGDRPVTGADARIAAPWGADGSGADDGGGALGDLMPALSLGSSAVPLAPARERAGTQLAEARGEPRAPADLASSGHTPASLRGGFASTGASPALLASHMSSGGTVARTSSGTASAYTRTPALTDAASPPPAPPRPRPYVPPIAVVLARLRTFGELRTGSNALLEEKRRESLKMRGYAAPEPPAVLVEVGGVDAAAAVPAGAGADDGGAAAGDAAAGAGAAGVAAAAPEDDDDGGGGGGEGG